MICTENWQASGALNAAHKLKRIENVLNGNELRKNEMKVLLLKHKKFRNGWL